jgi:hypothetical protein
MGAQTNAVAVAATTTLIPGLKMDYYYDANQISEKNYFISIPWFLQL